MGNMVYHITLVFLCISYYEFLVLVTPCWSDTKLFLKSWNIVECWKSQEKKTVSLFIPSFLVFLVINLDISSLFQNMPGIASFWLKAKRLSVHQTSYFWILLLLTLNINCLPSMLWKINFQEALYQKSVFFKISRVCVGWGLCGCMLCLFTVYDFSSFLFSLQK